MCISVCIYFIRKMMLLVVMLVVIRKNGLHFLLAVGALRVNLLFSAHIFKCLYLKINLKLKMHYKYKFNKIALGYKQ